MKKFDTGSRPDGKNQYSRAKVSMSHHRIDFLDFAKGFAILSIIIFHYSQPYATGLWSKTIMLGGTGIHVFFIISGFGLGLSSTKMKFTVFYKKRFTKIFIPYYAAILLIFFINEIFPIYTENRLYALGGHLFLYKMFDESIIESFGDHFWFISTIIQFYIVFPLIITIKNKILVKRFLVFSLLLSLAYWVTISLLKISHLRVYNSFFLQYLWEFNLGLVFAEVYIQKGKCFWDTNIVLLFSTSIAGLSLMALLALKGGQAGQTFNDVPASIGYLSTVAVMYLLVSNCRKIRSFINYMGKISYELYLLHKLLFLLSNKILQEYAGVNTGVLTSLFIAFPISIVIAKYFSSLTNIFADGRFKYASQS
ncbi:acyltransferase family protein [Desulfospira joergensenii]|uniref:acyltransferase family protein n=1 Tax=Desulfospira joergensenii TaxID=53329 RepID=UPI0004247C70|nr:acyltransferase [Desulfospira joergensenii]